MFAPGGALESTVAAARAAPDSAELERQAAEGVVDLSEVFSDAQSYMADAKPRPPSSLRDSREVEEEDADEWGSFDDDDWRGKGEGSEEALRPRGAGVGEEVPGLLGGERFSREEERKSGGGVDGVSEGAPSAASR